MGGGVMFETTAKLYAQTITADAVGNEIEKYIPRTVYIRRTRSVYTNEFYAAAAAGLKPSVVLVMFFGDYQGEQIVGWQGHVYNVTRTYRAPDSDDLEITLEETLEFIDGLEEEEAEG